jgi:transcriptional regulator with GAF, ATPase, and Fis domain
VSNVWLTCREPLDGALREAALSVLARSGLTPMGLACPETGVGVCVLRDVSDAVNDWLARVSRRATVMVLVLGDAGITVDQTWQLMSAGAADVIVWRRVPTSADDIVARLARLDRVAALMESEAVQRRMVGESACWRTTVREIVEAAAFGEAPVLIEGESGTGKELLAQLVHDLDGRPDKGDFVILDCAALTPELSGSEFFGHERGAFTGAVQPRDGAFALANGGTLFLDEVGELPPALQAQLLRVVQEHQYKRVGSNMWQRTEFRLVCATNRDLQACVADGRFRGDLYHRLAGWICRVPPLRDRLEDIMPLTRHFVSQLTPAGEAVFLDHSVQQFLTGREYPGNVRDLRQLVTRIWYRHAGPGPITPGDIPRRDRPDAHAVGLGWQDHRFASAIRRAVDLGAGLKEISRAAAETAIQIALAEEHDNVHRAALRLGLTDRAVQLRLAGSRQMN